MLYHLISGAPTFGLGDEVNLQGDRYSGHAYVVGLCPDPLREVPLSKDWKESEPFPQVMVCMKGTKTRVHLNGTDLKKGKLTLVKRAKPKGPTREETKQVIRTAILASQTKKGESNVQILTKQELDCFNELAHRIYFCGVDTQLFLYENHIYELVPTAYRGEYYIEHHKKFPAEGIEVTV